MSKRGKLSKVEVAYIQANYPKTGVGDLAHDMDRTVESVKKAIEDLGLNNNVKTDAIDGVTSPYAGGTAGQFIGRKVRDGKVIATVMTEAASERADESKRKPVVVTRYTENAVHKPLGKGSYDEHGQFKKAD